MLPISLARKGEKHMRIKVLLPIFLVFVLASGIGIDSHRVEDKLSKCIILKAIKSLSLCLVRKAVQHSSFILPEADHYISKTRSPLPRV